MAITWSIEQLYYALSLGGETNVVNKSYWQCIGTDDIGNQARVYGSVAIQTEDLSGFIPYADITEERAIAWTKSALGSEKVGSVEMDVANQLALIGPPTEGSGVPWRQDTTQIGA